LLLSAVAVVLLIGVSAVPRLLAGHAQPPSSASDNLQAARVEGRAARYHLTFADFARWQLKTDAPVTPGAGVDRWLTYGAEEEVYVIAMVIPIASADLDSTIEAVLASSRKQFTSMTEVERTPLNDRADRGVLIHLRALAPDSQVESFMGFFADEDAVYEIMALASFEAFPRLRRELEAIVRSFELPATAPAKTTLPPPPFALAAPPAPASSGAPKQTPGLLRYRAHEAAAKGDYVLAARLQRGAVDGGLRGKYDLACYLGRAGDIDASLYWLQSAIDEGVDPKWAEKDPDLALVRADPRWSQIRVFLREAERYWAASGLERTTVVVPRGYTPGKPIPVVVGLHGMGSIPEDFGGDDLQDIADTLSVAFVSASGTIPSGPASFHWAESVDRDDTRLDHALKEASDRVTIAPGKVILIGFSQGAQMAAEIVAKRPEKYVGAIVMSPGTQQELALRDLGATPTLAGHRFVVVVGAGEHPGNVALAASDARALRGAHADVFHRAYAGVNVHSFPPDFTSALPVWIRYILASGPRPPGETSDAAPAATGR
jgi:predicted esterase